MSPLTEAVLSAARTVLEGVTCATIFRRTGDSNYGLLSAIGNMGGDKSYSCTLSSFRLFMLLSVWVFYGL